MEELLVILACTAGKGCETTASQYYNSRPSLQEFVSYAERVVRAETNDKLIDYGTPAVLLALGYEGHVQLTSNWQLKFSALSTGLAFNLDF